MAKFAAGPVDVLLDLADPWVYVLVFLFALAEGAALVGLFLPGETSMIVGGVLVSQGRAALGTMLLAACAGSVIGDSVGYWLGRRLARRIREGRLGRKVGPARWERADAFVRAKGARAVFIGRFVSILRTLVPPLAGSTRMRYRRFVLYNAPAAALWATGFVLLGVGAGSSWEVVSKWSGFAGLLLLGVVVVGIAIALPRIRRHQEHLVDAEDVHP